MRSGHFPNGGIFSLVDELVDAAYRRIRVEEYQPLLTHVKQRVEGVGLGLAAVGTFLHLFVLGSGHPDVDRPVRLQLPGPGASALNSSAVLHSASTRETASGAGSTSPLIFMISLRWSHTAGSGQLLIGTEVVGNVRFQGKYRHTTVFNIDILEHFLALLSDFDQSRRCISTHRYTSIKSIGKGPAVRATERAVTRRSEIMMSDGRQGGRGGRGMREKRR